MKTDELREKYLEFFESKGHSRRPSDVLVPRWDPSVLFTPAGMNPFKDHFLGKVKLDFTRATSCQKCLRTGDIDNVGRTAYHHTFFEMLGNFSFGDYFKPDAIRWAWEFLTSKKWLGVDPARLSVTVYLDDDEAAGIWQNEIGLPASKIERMGEDDNFWPAGAPTNGPDGVCGPCSEIFYTNDQGKTVEIWNLVFTQFNRVGAPPNNLRPLPSKNIDTGMGLERMAASMQGVETNYHIDILLPIVHAAAETCEVKYDPASDHGRRLRRITDHLRACTFAVHENVYPGPQKERYVIRRLLRRAVLDGYQMGRREPFLHSLVGEVVAMMKGPYPELKETAERVAQVIRQEEQSFFGTIEGGLARIDRAFADMEKRGKSIVDGGEAGELYSTYGVPPELVESLAVERGWTFDWEGFRGWMQKHTTIQQWELFQTGPIEALKKSLKTTKFLGYEATEAQAVVKGLIHDGKAVESIAAEEQDGPVLVVLDQTPFYGESGGQVGDTGEFTFEGGSFVVGDTQKNGDLFVHRGELTSGFIRVGQKVTAKVDAMRRDGIRRAHSATHMLHHALQKTLGSHAQQQGSKVDEDWLRFDFTNLQPVDPDQLATIERDVNERIAEGAAVSAQILPLAKAREAGAMMLFGEKYPDPVRMVSMGSFSKELCGGIHLTNTREAQVLEIVGEEGISAGTRRVIALTGAKAREHREKTASALAQAASTLGVYETEVPAAAKAAAQAIRDLKKQVAGGGKAAVSAPSAKSGGKAADYPAAKATLREAARVLNVAPFEVPTRLESLLAETAELKKRAEQISQSGALSMESLLSQAETIGGARVVVAEAPGANSNLMRQLIDQIRQKSAPVAVLLATAEGPDKVTLVAGVSRDLVEKGMRAGDWVKSVAPVVGGGGGGKPDMAQAGGKDAAKIPAALEHAKAVAREMLKA